MERRWWVRPLWMTREVESEFFTSGTYSIVLMAVVDSNVAVDVGACGWQSDGVKFSNTKFGRALENSLVCLPPPRRLPGDTTIAPHVFVGDEAFQLRSDFLRPRCVKIAFGVMTLRFRIFRGIINLLPENADYVVVASCVLHNFLSEGVFYMPYGNTTDRSDFLRPYPGT
ncbi:hypothetical protein MRX96_036811 [Rhipicephalus microplus]